MATLHNRTKNTIVSSRVKVARTPWERLVGFLDSKSIEEDEAMWFDRCTGVHTLGMRARIDVVFLDDSLEVLAVERNVGANRINICCPQAASIIELGASEKARFSVGDVLSLDAR
ncbi:MAG: DUF192 domain-containing protein [Candidatus Baltobacteraceae bacterium]